MIVESAVHTAQSIAEGKLSGTRRYVRSFAHFHKRTDRQQFTEIVRQKWKVNNS